MIAIIDYGVGNLFSVKSSFDAIGAKTVVTSSPEEIKRADKILLPGVGAFEKAAEKLRASGLDGVICEEAARGKALLGICLGMQLLFERSLEYGEHQGLGLIKGDIVPIECEVPSELKIPHIGWNKLHFTENESRLFSKIKDGDCVYFVHSYYAKTPAENIIATAEYGKELTAAAQCGNVFGCQFHPEKSGNVGLNILRAFCEI